MKKIACIAAILSALVMYAPQNSEAAVKLFHSRVVARKCKVHTHQHVRHGVAVEVPAATGQGECKCGANCPCKK